MPLQLNWRMLEEWTGLGRAVGGRGRGGGGGGGTEQVGQIQPSRCLGTRASPEHLLCTQREHEEQRTETPDHETLPRHTAQGKSGPGLGWTPPDEQEAQEQLEGREGHERATEATPTESGAGPSATTDPRQKPEGSQRLATLAGMLSAVWP